jgi:tRNA(Ile2) C34 agmatinyltransferase TiaS
MKIGTILIGAILLVFGLLEYTETTSFLAELNPNIGSETVAMLLLLLGLAIAVTGSVLSLKRPASTTTINPNDMKTCPACGRSAPADAPRCPSCGERFKSIQAWR